MIIYVGLSGTILAGKGAAKELIENNYSTYSISLSDVLRKDLKEKKIESTRENLIAYANDLRKRDGNDILAKRTIEVVKKDEPTCEIVIFDSVRTVAEINCLRQKYGKDFLLLFIDAPVEIRYKRSLLRARASEEKASFEQFKRNDDAESGRNGKSHVQQLVKCKEIADAVIVNDGTLQKLKENLIKLINAKMS